MGRISTVLLILLLAWSASAQDFAPSLSTTLKDEGVSQGQVKTLNCVGAGIACTRSGTTGTLSVAGGGAGNFAEATVDFGANGADLASVVVTGQAWVTASSVIMCSPTLFATADRTDGMEDGVIEGLTVGVSARVVATGFTVQASPRYGRAIGKYLIHCTGA